MNKESLQDLFTDYNLLNLKNISPRIVEAYINNKSHLVIHYYATDNMELWIDDYEKLNNILKECFEKYHKDKTFSFKVVTNI